MANTPVARWRKAVLCGTALALVPTLGPGCKTDTGRGAMLGGGTGALVGALIDHPHADPVAVSPGGLLLGG